MQWLDNLVGRLYGADQLQAENDAYVADTQAWQQSNIDSGKWTAQQGAQAQADLANEAAQNANVAGQIGSEFDAGLVEGLDNVLAAPGQVVGAVGNGAGKLGWGILKNIPWWAWVAGAIALFVWAGGLTLLRGRLAKKLAA